jgi:hypothetical protein
MTTRAYATGPAGPVPGTADQSCATRASNGKPATLSRPNQLDSGAGPGQLAEQIIQSTAQVNSIPASRTGSDSNASNMEHSTEPRTVKFQIRTRRASCNFGVYPLPAQAAINTNKAKLLKWTAKIRNPSLPMVASPITHSCALAPSPPRHAAPVTLPPTHHIWFSHTGPSPSVT